MISFSDLKRWMIILSVLLFAVNIGFFILYTHTIQSESIALALWGYFESSIFQGITASILAPLIFFFLENKLKILSSIQENREREQMLKEQTLKEKQAELKELHQKREEENREKRWQAVIQTTKTLQNLNGLVSDVRFYDNHDKRNINEMMKDIATLSVSFSDLINMWIFRFPILSKKMASLFVDYVIVMYWGSWAVGHSIKYETTKDITEMQENLAMIQRGIIATLYHPLINTLKHTTRLLELVERDITIQSNSEHQETLIDIIKLQVEKVFQKNFETGGEIYKIIQDEMSPPNLVEIPYGEKENNIIFQVPKKPIRAIWIQCMNATKNQLGSLDKTLTDELNKKNISIDEEIKSKMDVELEKLILNLIQLKIFSLLLKIDKFKNEEILSESINKENSEAVEFRKDYQEFRKWKTDSKILQVGSEEYYSFINSEFYLKFLKDFYKIRDDVKMNVIANDTISRLKEIGITIRFGSIIPFTEEDIESVR